MEVVLHYPPEKPYLSCRVLVFHKHTNGDIYNVSNVYYSAKNGLFNSYDHQIPDEGDYEYQNDLVAWAYMDEINVEVLRCLNRLK